MKYMATNCFRKTTWKLLVLKSVFNWEVRRCKIGKRQVHNLRFVHTSGKMFIENGVLKLPCDWCTIENKTAAWQYQWYMSIYRSSHQRCCVRKGVLRNFAKFQRKHLCQSLQATIFSKSDNDNNNNNNNNNNKTKFYLVKLTHLKLFPAATKKVSKMSVRY